MGEMADFALDQRMTEVFVYLERLHGDKSVEPLDEENPDECSDNLGLEAVLGRDVHDILDPTRVLTTRECDKQIRFASLLMRTTPDKQTYKNPQDLSDAYIKTTEYILKCWDEKLCLKCKASMVERTGPYGKFWGCADFPKCSGKPNFKTTFNRERTQSLLNAMYTERNN